MRESITLTIREMQSSNMLLCLRACKSGIATGFYPDDEINVSRARWVGKIIGETAHGEEARKWPFRVSGAAGFLSEFFCCCFLCHRCLYRHAIDLNEGPIFWFHEPLETIVFSLTINF